MQVECDFCEKYFDVTEAVAIVCDYKADTTNFLCSKECVENYSINVQEIFPIEVKKDSIK